MIIRRRLTATVWAMFLLTLLLIGPASAAPDRLGGVGFFVLAMVQIGLSPLVALTLRRPLSTWRGFLMLVAATGLFLFGLSRWLGSLPAQWPAWQAVSANIALMLDLDLVFVSATAVLILCRHGQGAKVLALGWLSFPLVWLFVTNHYGSQAAMLGDSVTNQLALIMALVLTSVMICAGVAAILASVVRLTFSELRSSPKAISPGHTTSLSSESIPT